MAPKTIVLSLLLISSALISADETSNLRDFTSGNKLFTSAVYNELLVDGNSFVISPFSLETALALTQTGAVDETGEEIRNSLYLPSSKDETEAAIKAVLPYIQSENYTLKTVNKIYVEENYSVKKEFQDAALDIYQAGFQNIDFAVKNEAAEEINLWVEKATEGKIKDLISPDDLDQYTRLVLINALYFKATWLYPFRTDYTTKLNFFRGEDDSIETDFMVQVSIKHKYYENKELDVKILELPFEGEDASITFVLPNKIDGIKILEKQIDQVFVSPEFTTEQVYVELPKFRIETTTDFNEILRKLGVRKVFNPLEADLSGIAGEPGQLYVSKVKQKTFISVDENGIEAAAATSVDIPIRAEISKKFVADHPFMFYIKVKDVILFEGRVLEPTL